MPRNNRGLLKTINLDFITLVYAKILFLDRFFTFRAKFDGNLFSVDFDCFILKVWFVVARGFAVTVAHSVAAHFAFAASVAYS